MTKKIKKPIRKIKSDGGENKKPLVYGIHAVTQLLASHAERVLQLYVAKERMDQKIQLLCQDAKAQRIAINYVAKNTLDNLTHEGNHQGIAAECQKLKTLTEHDLSSILENAAQPVCLLILDGVQDPHNLGACFRSADAFAVTAIIVPKDNAVGLTPVVTKVASGAAEIIPFVQVTNLARTMDMLKEKGIWIYGAAMETTQTIYQTDFKGNVAIVLGAEGSGLRRLTREKCDGLVNIPMHGAVASLNVSVATGIFLAEIMRQRFNFS